MVTGMALAAVACVVLAVTPAVLAPALRRVLAELPAAQAVAFTDFGAIVRLPGLSGSIAPGLLAGSARRRDALGRHAVIAAGVEPAARAGAAAVGVRLGRTDPENAVHRNLVRRTTATCLRQRAATRHRCRGHPLRGVPLHGAGGHLPRRDRRCDRTPALRARSFGRSIAAAQLVRRAHTGSVHLYLAYGALGVLVVLVVAR